MSLCKILRKKDVGATGIGAMIVFIATVLVAGIAASVMIQTSMKLESQAMATGQKTVKEVASGMAVTDITGHVTGGFIDKLTITVRPRAGSPDVDLYQTFIELSDATNKIILAYDANPADSWYDSTTGVEDIFAGTTTAFPTSANRFGIVPVEDADGSCSIDTPIINIGDKVMLCINADEAFTGGGLAVRIDLRGAVIPEDGSTAVIGFTTPSSYGAETIFDLQ
ncbi:MAG: flagellin [Euryarchaeota archaeon]|nr:flagellin [Euryarchaeota archaeon]